MLGYKNIEAARILAREVFPKISEKIKDAKLVIVVNIQKKLIT